MKKRIPDYCHQKSRARYALNYKGIKYHIADKNSIYYLCACAPSFRYKDTLKHCIGRVRMQLKFPWEPKLKDRK